MVDEELNHLESEMEEIERLMSENEVIVKKLRIILARDEENKRGEQNFMEGLTKEEKADENPLQIQEYATEATKLREERYELVDGLRKHIIHEIGMLYKVKDQMEIKKILLTKSFSNEGGKNE